MFAEQGAVDFPQGSLAALAALGESDAPTDLLLRLDLRLEHLLIDEFQDTSFAQLELLRAADRRMDPGATAGRCSRSAIRCSRSTASAARKSACSSTRSSAA